MLRIKINREYSKEITFDIDPNFRTAILGENGIGKSTILNKIANEDYHDENWCSVTVPNKMKIAYFSQIIKNDSEISGGEHTKQRLERLFSLEVDLYVLDEPTNNLDEENIDWLKNHILKNKIKIVFTSHNIDFIDEMAEVIFYMDSKTVEKTQQKCSQYLIDRKIRIEKEFADYELNLRNHERLEKSVRLAKAEFEAGTKWENEDKGLQGFKREMAGKFGGATIKRLTKRADAVDIKEPENDPIPRVHLQNIKNIKNILEYSGKTIKDKNVYFNLSSGDKIIFCGENGSGKTTLVKKMVSNLKNIKYIYLSQNWYEEIDNEVVIEHIAKYFPNKEDAYKIISFNNLKENILTKKFKDLSPGVRIKIMLGILSRSKFDLIIWDEPTNHLDVMSQIVLQEAFLTYPGALLLVTHDKKLINNEIFTKIEF